MALRLLLLAGLASLALLSLGRGSVAAEGPGDTASITAQGNELWSATLRVSNHRGLMGYSTYWQRTFGHLSSDQFTWQGTTYTVNKRSLLPLKREFGRLGRCGRFLAGAA